MVAPALPPAALAAEVRPAEARPTNAPSAFTIEYRALDRCFVPQCAIQSRDVLGWQHELQGDGDPGAYAKKGTEKTKALLRRATHLTPKGELAFDLPPSDDDSELDVYFAAFDATGPWRARIDVAEVKPSRALVPIAHEDFGGETRDSEAERIATLMDDSALLVHHRVKLPSRKGRSIHVVVRNAGDKRLVVGNPLVMKKVARPARQFVMVVLDQVPYPYFRPLLTEGGGDEKLRWVPKLLAEKGTYFANTTSPGMNTASFIRRFMRTDFFDTAGEPVLSGLGFDDTPPKIAASRIARLAEQGFMTEVVMNNFAMMPTNTRLAFDGGFHAEGKEHPTWLTKRFAAWIHDHPADDAYVLVWFSNTHMGSEEGFGRTGVKPPTPEGLTNQEILGSKMRTMWKNALEDFDHFGEMVDTAKASDPTGADRIWLLLTDHGSSFEYTMYNRIGRVPRSGFSWFGTHGVWGSRAEVETPFAVFFDRGRPSWMPARFEDRASSVAVWRVLENAFGVDVALPSTSEFELPIVPRSGAGGAIWDDRGVFSCGNTGSVREMIGPWAYRGMRKNFSFTPLFKEQMHTQRLLGGSDSGTDAFPGEELYDTSFDPYEKKNVADRYPDRIYDMRRRWSDFLAAHDVPVKWRPARYVLTFGETVDLTLRAPRDFDLSVDGKPIARRDLRSAEIHGKRIEITERERPVRIVELGGVAATKRLVLRCGGNGVPLDALGPDRARFDLGTAAHNCPAALAVAKAPARDGDVAFEVGAPARGSADATSPMDQAGQATGGNDDFVAGLKRWGYVRDIDPKKH